MKTTTFWVTLMQLARAEAIAEKSGDPEAYEKAKAEHEAYKQLCLNADTMIIPSFRHIR